MSLAIQLTLQWLAAPATSQLDLARTHSPRKRGVSVPAAAADARRRTLGTTEFPVSASTRLSNPTSGLAPAVCHTSPVDTPTTRTTLALANGQQPRHAEANTVQATIHAHQQFEHQRAQ